MSEDGYLKRVATEARNRGLAENREVRREELDRRRWTLDKIFEAHKHLSTLSATALVLIFAADRLDAADVDVLLGMVSFGLSLILSLWGMRTALFAELVGKGLRKDVEDLAFGELMIGIGLFTASVLLVVVWPSVEAQLRGG